MRMWVSNSRPSLMRSILSVHVPDYSPLSPATRNNFPLHRSLGILPLSTSSLSEAIKGPGLDYQGQATRNLPRPRAPRPAPPRHRRGDTTRHQNKHACGGASQPSPPHTQGSDEIISLRKLQLYALLSKIGRVEGVEGRQRAVEIMIIGGFLTSS
jgi:hypothetical protein